MTTYTDRAGNAVTADEALNDDGTLRSGFGIRTPMYAMDALQRAVFEDKRRRRTVHRDPLGREAGTSEEEEEEEQQESEPPRRRKKRYPIGDTGTEFFIDDATRGVLDHMQGCDEALRQLWRDGRAAAEQARQDMIDAGSNAWRGDTRPADERIADAAPALPPRIMSMADAQRVRDEAYRKMVDDGETAWRRGR